MITWNVWFGGESWDNPRLRYETILEICQNLDADVICFQEVTQTFIDVLQASELYTNFVCPTLENSEDFKNPYYYGQLTCVQKDRVILREESIVSIPSSLGRKCLKTVIEKKQIQISIGNVHLESMSMCDMQRKKQLEIILPHFSKIQNGIICGDFNLCATSDENEIIEKSSMKDVWGYLKPEEDGWTENTSLNGMRYRAKPKTKHVRFDRFLLNEPSDLFPQSIQLLGTEYIQHAVSHSLNLEEQLWPSDHFGLFIVLNVGHQPTAEAQQYVHADSEHIVVKDEEVQNDVPADSSKSKNNIFWLGGKK